MARNKRRRTVPAPVGSPEWLAPANVAKRRRKFTRQLFSAPGGASDSAGRARGPHRVRSDLAGAGQRPGLPLPVRVHHWGIVRGDDWCKSVGVPNGIRR